jgi:uncharacterized protein
MKVIDAHLHFSNIESFHRTAREISRVVYTTQGLKEEFDRCGVVAGIAMGLQETTLGGFPDADVTNPMGLDLEEVPDCIFQCAGINPVRLTGDGRERELSALEEQLRNPRTVGIKIYAGYYPYHVYDRIYEPVYEMAAAYKLPVVIHCGDTYSERGLLKYSHPINVDELAVRHRDINFIMAHFGDPWVLDAGEVVMKNWNVHTDLSGLIVGDTERIEKYKNIPIYTDHFRRGLLYADNYKRILYGTDWPLAPMEPYMDFVKSLIPQEHWEDVFYNNAVRVFSRLSQFGY